MIREGLTRFGNILGESKSAIGIIIGVGISVAVFVFPVGVKVGRYGNPLEIKELIATETRERVTADSLLMIQHTRVENTLSEILDSTAAINRQICYWRSLELHLEPLKEGCMR